MNQWDIQAARVRVGTFGMSLRRGRLFRFFAVLLCGLSLCSAVWAVTVEDLRKIVNAPHKPGDGHAAYRAARDAIVAEGRSALPVLESMLRNEQAPWDVRLAAGVCAERIEKGGAIDALDAYDWFKDPDYDASWGITATGYPSELVPLIQRRLSEAGLWYHYVAHYWRPAIIPKAKVNHLDRFYQEAVFLSSTGMPRYLASQVASAGVERWLSTSNRWNQIHIDALEALVADGTYPDGIRLLFEAYLASQSYGINDFTRRMRRYLRTQDIDWLTGLLRTGELPHGCRLYLDERLAELVQERSLAARQPVSTTNLAAVLRSPDQRTDGLSTPSRPSTPPNRSRWYLFGGIAVIFGVSAGAAVWHHRRNRGSRGSR